MLKYTFVYILLLYGLPMLAQGRRSLIVIAAVGGAILFWQAGSIIVCERAPACSNNEMSNLKLLVAVSAPVIFSMGIFMRGLCFVAPGRYLATKVAMIVYGYVLLSSVALFIFAPVSL